MIRSFTAYFFIAASFAPSAYAENSRTWVSGAGVDQAGCGPIASPCRTLQYAHDNTAPGGEIDVKDSAGYGPLKITKAISVVNDGAALAGILPDANSNGVTINASPYENVVLKGLTINGADLLKGIGIEFIAGQNLTVEKCNIRNFATSGIMLRSSSYTVRAAITNSVLQMNNEGITYRAQGVPSGGAIINIDHVTAIDNKRGFAIEDATGSTSPIFVNISSSTSHGNSNDGVLILSGTSTTVMVDLCEITGNQSGIFQQTGSVYISRSNISGNLIGVNGGSNMYTTSDNRIFGNTTTDVIGTLIPASLK